MSTGCHRFKAPHTARPTIDIGRPMRMPTRIIVPRSTPSALAMKSGPGVGGTIEWVTAAPATMAVT
jgi:hypothetical protein